MVRRMALCRRAHLRFRVHLVVSGLLAVPYANLDDFRVAAQPLEERLLVLLAPQRNHTRPPRQETTRVHVAHLSLQTCVACALPLGGTGTAFARVLEFIYEIRASYPYP